MKHRAKVEYLIEFMSYLIFMLLVLLIMEH